jgi:hypothetical protein
MDRAGNESEISPPVSVTLANTLEKALNGNFDLGISNWALSIFDSQAGAAFGIDSTYILDGKNSAKIDVTQSSGTNWHIQLSQPLKIFANHKYKIRFTAKSSDIKHLVYFLQQSNSPYTIYLSGAVTLTNSPQIVSDSVLITSNDDVKFSFILGSTELVTVWIDDVSISESKIGTTAVKENNNIIPSKFYLLQNYPNPFNPSTTIKYQMPKPGLVTLKVYDILGKEIINLVNENKIAGFYEVNFDASKLPSGIYIYQLKVNDFVSNKKMILLK